MTTTSFDIIRTAINNICLKYNVNSDDVGFVYNYSELRAAYKLLFYVKEYNISFDLDKSIILNMPQNEIIYIIMDQIEEFIKEFRERQLISTLAGLEK